MTHQKSNRLWKFEDAHGKVEVYVCGYGGSSPNNATLRCDVLARGIVFSGKYTTSLCWQDILSFGRDCSGVRASMEDRGGITDKPAKLESVGLTIVVAPSGARQARWEISCRPRASEDSEILRMVITSEYQLLNAIQTGARNVWQQWPGPRPLAAAGGIGLN